MDTIWMMTSRSSLQPPLLQLPFLSPQLGVQRTTSRVPEYLKQMMMFAQILAFFHADGLGATGLAFCWHYSSTRLLQRAYREDVQEHRIHYSQD